MLKHLLTIANSLRALSCGFVVCLWRFFGRLRPMVLVVLLSKLWQSQPCVRL
jgi:hypothetical protein